MKRKIAVLIRVYNRIEDLLCNLQVIDATWTENDYRLFIVSNGRADGHKVPDNIQNQNCRLIELPANSGHFSGNAQLLIEGLRHIPLADYDYVLILEADTWTYGDGIISKYADKLAHSGAVWASARWYDKFRSLATDFALIDARFLEQHSDIFNFAQTPECYVYNYLDALGAGSILIRENQPPMLPSYIKRFPYAPAGRFYVFPRSRTVTHHVEQYAPGEGFRIKKRHFNIVAGTRFFQDVPNENYFIQQLKMRLTFALQVLLLRRSWYSKRQKWIKSES